MSNDQEDGMPGDTTSVFATVIQEHLELRRRNAALEPEMPLERYMPDDPFQNHPLFKTEEQARIEDTMDGAQSIVDEPTSLEWPAESSFPVEDGATAEQPEVQPEEESVEVSEDSLWTRSRDFDWGD
jgi:hypothetical protein